VYAVHYTNVVDAVHNVAGPLPGLSCRRMPERDDMAAGHTPASDQPRRGPRPRGAVRPALIEAGLELARSGGPGAVVLREVTRQVGVVPNTAYRHFADRDSLLAAVRDEAVRELAGRMADGMSQVRAGAHTPMGARLRMQAVGKAYLEFARTEPGLFDTAFAAADHPMSSATAGSEPEMRQPLEYVQGALDDLVQTGLLEANRRPSIEYPVWAAVHGLATLLRGPLRALPDRKKAQLEIQTLAFIGAALS
jgi:AcrR family transcriptional regulator